MTGPITDVSVTLHGVSHTEPEQMRVMLVSPSATAVLLMDFDCGSQEVVDASWIFTEKALAEIPDNGPCDGTVYRPTGSISRLAWPPDAPFNSATLGLGKFTREDANGTWKLYVADATSTETGKIAGGWTLAIETFDGPIDMLVPEAGSSGAASTYPSTRTVSGQAGVISDVNVGIDGIWHQSPRDLDMLLVGPAGQKVVLASDACGEPGVEALNWSFDDEAAGPPPAPYGTSLAALDGTDPNGEWQLFVADGLFLVGFQGAH